jgi:D-alanine-D-alanine ligase-like ATP-grasp enzyme
MTTGPGKVLLILASKLGYQTRSFSQAAGQLGVEVVFGTDRCHQLDDPWADGALALQFQLPREAADVIASAFRGKPSSAILALGDQPTVAAAFAAQALGLPGNPPLAAESCRNKLLQRETLRRAGLPVPKFFALPAGLSPEGALAEISFPCVIKPVALAASQGVIRANNPAEFGAAVWRIRALLESPEIQMQRTAPRDKQEIAAEGPAARSHDEVLLVEEYIPGAEVALEGLMDTDAGGMRLRTLAIFDKPDPLDGPFFEETIYVTPSRLPENIQRAVMDGAEAAARALGLRHGPLHAEFRVHESRPWILELAPRPIGGLCARALRFGPDEIGLEELLIRHALSLGGDQVFRETCASGVMMIPVPRSGILERVIGIEDAERMPLVSEIRITARLRDYNAAWPEGASYLGFIFARGDTPLAVESALRAAHARLKFEFSPRLPVEHPVTGRVSVIG